MPSELRKAWNIGSPVNDDEGYYRNDDDLVRYCLGGPYDSNKVVRVLAARRFGKTSFLKRVKRWADGNCGGEDANRWDTAHFIDFHSPTVLDQIAALQQMLQGPDGRKTERRHLVLIDEFSSLHTNRELARPAGELLELALEGDDPPDHLRIVIVDASNMNDSLLKPDSPLPHGLSARLADLDARTMRCLSKREADLLMTHRNQHEPPRIEEDLLQYAGYHPLLLQYVCHAHFTEGVRSLREFLVDYAPRRGVRLSVQSIYDNLSLKEKLVLRYFLLKDRVTVNEFNGAGAGLVTLGELQSFGLVVGHEDASYSICSPSIREYMANLPANQGDPAEDESPEVVELWPSLFTTPRVSKTPPAANWTIHHIGNLHLPTAAASAPSGERADSPRRRAWAAYKRYLPKRKPQLLIVAGDVLLHNAPGGFHEQFLAATETITAIGDELDDIRENCMQPVDNKKGQVIVVPGDTDPLIAEGPSEKLVWTHFRQTFKKWDTWQYFRDVPILIAPMNTADIPEEVVCRVHEHHPTEKQVFQSRRILDESLHNASPQQSHHEAYTRHMVANFGCLAAGPEELDKILGEGLAATQPADDDPNYEHALRIAVFHHNVEQRNIGDIVDLWAAGAMKQVFAKHKFSLALHAHYLSPFVHCDSIYRENSPRSWTLHEIACGAMNPLALGDGMKPCFNKISIQAVRVLGKSGSPGPRHQFNIRITRVSLSGDEFTDDRENQVQITVER